MKIHQMHCQQLDKMTTPLLHSEVPSQPEHIRGCTRLGNAQLIRHRMLTFKFLTVRFCVRHSVSMVKLKGMLINQTELFIMSSATIPIGFCLKHYLPQAISTQRLHWLAYMHTSIMVHHTRMKCCSLNNH